MAYLPPVRGCVSPPMMAQKSRNGLLFPHGKGGLQWFGCFLRS